MVKVVAHYYCTAIPFCTSCSHTFHIEEHEKKARKYWTIQYPWPFRITYTQHTSCLNISIQRRLMFMKNRSSSRWNLRLVLHYLIKECPVYLVSTVPLSVDLKQPRCLWDSVSWSVQVIAFKETNSNSKCPLKCLKILLEYRCDCCWTYITLK